MNRLPLGGEGLLTLLTYQLFHPEIYTKFPQGVLKERENNPTAKHLQVPVIRGVRV